MSIRDEFAGMVQEDQPLGRWTSLGTGGNARYVATPTNVTELGQLLVACQNQQIPYRVLGGGRNVLVRDQGFAGMVIRLTAPAFQDLQIQGEQVTAGAGVELAALIEAACNASLAGLEEFTGIPGTVGGATFCNVSSRTSDLSQFIHSVVVVRSDGNPITLMRSDIHFGSRYSGLDDGVIVGVTFRLTPDQPDDINKRIKKSWIVKQTHQPEPPTHSAYVFPHQRGMPAHNWIERAELRGIRVGEVELYDRDMSFLIAKAGATSNDVQRLIELVCQRVREKTGAELQSHLEIW